MKRDKVKICPASLAVVGLLGCGASSSAIPADAIDDAGASSAGGEGGASVDAPTSVGDLYVSALRGSDTNVGSRESPLKTLKMALSIARPGARILLLPGTYDDANGETFPARVGRGITIAAEGVARPAISGPADVTGLEFAGDAVLERLSIVGFSSAITVRTDDAVTMTDVEILKSKRAVDVAGGTLTWTNGKVLAAGACDKGSLSVTGGTARFENVDVDSNAGTVVHAGGTADVTIKGMSTVRAGACPGSVTVAVASTAAKLTLEDVVINGPVATTTIGIYTTSTEPVIMKGGAINNVGSSAISAQQGKVIVTGTKLIGNGTAITLADSSGDVSGAQLSTNNAGISVLGASSLKMRSTTIANTPTIGIALTQSATMNLGDAASPGGNLLAVVQALDLRAAAAGTYEAVGNTWNVGLQGADATGHYAAGYAAQGPTTGANFALKTGQTLKLGL